MALVALVASDAAANAQAQLPQVTVIGAKKPKPAAVARRAVPRPAPRTPPPTRVAKDEPEASA